MPKAQDDIGLNTAKSTQRLCIVSRQPIDRDQGLRFVADPNGVCTFDIKSKLPGRGVWVAANKTLIETAIKTNAFSRGLKRQVDIPPKLSDKIEVALTAQCKNTLSLCAKTGALIIGADACENFVLKSRPHSVAWLVLASNLANLDNDSVVKRATKLQRNMAIASVLTGEDIGQSIGRPFVAHAMIRAGAMARVWQKAYRKLMGFRELSESAWNTTLNPLNTHLVAAN